MNLFSLNIKKAILFSFIFLSMLGSATAQTPAGFNLVAYEGFNYTSGSSLLNANGGSGWSGTWSKSYQDRVLKTGNTGFSYAGLTTSGLKAEFNTICSGACNEITALGRSFPLQDKGVIYFQFISVFEATGGFGTPGVRFYNGGVFTGSIGANSGSKMAIIDVAGTQWDSSGALATQNLVVVRIDYNLNKTDMWVNPNLSTFDYSNPVSPSATASGFAPAFDRFDIYIRSGSIDEISIFAQPTSAPTISSFTPTAAGTGDSVVITGTNFNLVTQVQFGSVAASSFTIDSPTQITAVVAAGSSGNVTLTKAGANVALAGFIYKIVEYNFNSNALDETGSNRDGSISGGVTFGTGVEGQSACFDRSTSNYIALPNNLIRSLSDFTISLRFKTSSKGIILGYQQATVDNATSTQYIPIIMVQSGGKLRATLWKTTGSDITVLSSTLVNDGNWHKVDMSVTPTSISFYLDGLLVGSGSGTVDHLNMQVNQIGRGMTSIDRDSSGGDLSGWQGFTGCIDNFLILDKGQSLATITQVTQLPVPTLTSFTPGICNIGDTVTITGTNFTGATSVLMGTIPVTNFTVVSDTQITAVTAVAQVSTISVITAGGTAVSATNLTVNKLNPSLSNFNNTTKKYFDATYTLIPPTSTIAEVFSYSSSDLNVATISGAVVTITGAGTATITATQAGNSDYNSASITATLTVTSVSVLTKGGGISSTNLNYVNQYGQIGGNFGLSANGAILNVKSPSNIVTPGITYTILDQYTNNRVPTGTSYVKLQYYSQYIDAGSIDASPFVITKQTTYSGGILFYGSTELNSESNENTFRLTATSGNFDFISFKLDDLEQNIPGGQETASTIPIITLTSSSGSTISFQSTVHYDAVYDYYMYWFMDSGVKTLNWNNVEWVDIKTKYVKAKTKDYVLKAL